MYLHIPCQVCEYHGEIARLEGELTSAKNRITGLEKSFGSAVEEIEARKQKEAEILRNSAEEKGQLEKRIETLQVCVCVHVCMLAYVGAYGVQHMSPLLRPFRINVRHYKFR